LTTHLSGDALGQSNARVGRCRNKRKGHMDYNQIKRTYERLSRSGALQTAKRLSEQHNERIAEMQKQSLTTLGTSQLKHLETTLERLTTPPISPQADRVANNIAAQALRASNRSRLHAIDTINAGQFANIVHHASVLASAPRTQELLRRVDEVSRTGEVDIPEDTDLSPGEIPAVPQMEWVFELNYENLLFMFRVLFHLTTILSAAYGVAIALSDHEIDREEWAEILDGLNVILLFIILALEKRGAR
jgi:hypothetical protein